MMMCRLAFFAALPTLAVGLAAAPSAQAPEPAAAPQVRQLRVKLGKVLEHASALSPSLVAEARHVDDDASRALRGKGASVEADLKKVVDEFAAFSAHLSSRADALQHEAAPALQLSEEALAKAKKLVPVLESKVKKVLEHMKADKGPESTAHAAVVSTLEHAVASVAGQSTFERAVALHKALASAHDFLAIRTKELAADRERLNEEIEEQQALILFMMLRQRRKLPMKAQMALLRRHQFKDCGYAQKLLKAHSSAQPLADQLLAMVPKALAQKLAKKDQKGDAGHLAAAGSDGRVQIVSSRMKNAVQMMATEMTQAKSQLEQILSGKSADITAAERTQAKEILASLEDILKRLKSTHDLKSQMEAMDEVQNKLKTWMMNAAKHK